jgi:hypothetical protein
MRHNSAKNVALGGVMAALAVVVMCMGTLIPVATFICPMVCMILLTVVKKQAENRTAWAWYGAVSILSVLLAPDKEAAAVFVFLGYYPIIKPWMDKRKLSFLWKLVLFNAAILVMYILLIHLFGLTSISEDFQELGTVMTVVTLILGNITLFLFDFNLTLLDKKSRRKHG